jgi:hypothetical protein
MFNEFASQVWTPSDAAVVVSNNTDTSIDGSSKKIVWTAAANKYVTISFTAIDLSTWEEISFYVYIKDLLTESDIFRVTIDGNDYDFSRTEFNVGWNHVLVDCSNMGSISSIVITSLVANLTMFVDYFGYRKATYNIDVDVITALKNHLNLDYDVETTLSAAASAGDTEISLTSKNYINDSAVLELDDGAGTTEEVELLNREGELVSALSNSFSQGDTVRALCPIRSEDYDDLEPDPVCGITVYDVAVNKEDVLIVTKNRSKLKQYLGTLGILIYIDCKSKKKLLQMVREYNKKYGEGFEFLLDGEQVEIYMDNSIFNDGIIGTNPRMAYYYRLEPQPYLFINATPVDVDNITLTMDVQGANE